MAITVTGVRIDTISVSRGTGEDTTVKFGVVYSIMGSNGTALAQQLANDGYGSKMTVPLTAEIAKSIKALSETIKNEIEGILGFKEE